MKTPFTFIVTSNKGGSGKTPVAINLVMWALSQRPPKKVLVVDINHVNQDFFNAMKHLKHGVSNRYENSFTIEDVGLAYYLPLSDNIHLVRSQSFQPLSQQQVVSMVTDSAAAYAEQKGAPVFQPDIVIVDGNYCFPSYRPKQGATIDTLPFVFFNIWSLTSPHELVLPKEYRTTIGRYKEIFNDEEWDRTHFIHVFSILEKARSITSEVTRMFTSRRGIYTVPGSDDLSSLYKKIALDTTTRVEGYPFDQVQREVFSRIMAELKSILVEEPTSYTEDVINERWINRINIFITEHKNFPLNILPMPHYYPFLRKAVIDMILRERIDIPEIEGLFADFFTWISMFMDRYFPVISKA